MNKEWHTGIYFKNSNRDNDDGGDDDNGKKEF